MKEGRVELMLGVHRQDEERGRAPKVILKDPSTMILSKVFDGNLVPGAIVREGE